MRDSQRARPIRAAPKESQTMDSTSPPMKGRQPQQPTPRRVETKVVNLALQGGGSHGAFTWGVMDKILEDGRLNIDGLSATSAGAMNAGVYAYHHMIGGQDGTRP